MLARLLSRSSGRRVFSSTNPWVLASQEDAKRMHQEPVDLNENGDAGQSATAKLGAALRRVTYEDVAQAYKRISGTVKKTPCDYSPALSEMTGCHLYIKKEHISMTGSYKERGALNKILQLSPEERARGVICNSAGNHAQAVSHHSTRLGIDGLIVMPETAPFVKVASTRFFGAKVLLHGKGFDDAYQKAMQLVKDEGRTLVHAFNDPAVVAGQGTVAMEMLEQCAFLDAVVVPIGGGGLLAGMSLAIKKINPRIKVYGVEASAMPGMFKSVLAEKPTHVPRQKTMADGIAIENIGDVPFALIKDYVDEIVLVSEDEIASAILTLLEVEKTVVEGSGACALAAVMHGKLNLKGLQVGIITTGGNIDMTLLGRIIDRGLVKDGRMARIRVTIEDVPGQIAKVAAILAEQRALVREIEHERAFLGENIGYTAPMFTIETRDHEHIQTVLHAIQQGGFPSASLSTTH